MRALAILAVPVLALASARTADAGACLSAEEADEGMASIEAYAKAKARSEERERNYQWLCVELDAQRLRRRIERACRVILDRDGLESPCATIVAAAGVAQLGKHDLYAWAAERLEDPLTYGADLGSTRIQVLGLMGDPRGLPALLDAWKAAIPRAAAREKHRRSMMGWSAWRQDAARSLGALGGKDEIAFLDEQAKATKDSFVARACRDAIAAIEKRLAKAAAAAPAAPTAPASASPAAPAAAPAAPKAAPASAPAASKGASPPKAPAAASPPKAPAAGAPR